MGNTCKTCRLPAEDLLMVNLLLVNGVPLRHISAQFKIGTSSLKRHRDLHIPEELAKAKHAEEATAGETLLEELNDLREEAARTARKAEEAGDGTLHLRSVDTRARMVRIKADVAGVIHQKIELDDKGIQKELEETRSELEQWIQFVKRVAPALFQKYIAAHGEEHASDN